MSDRLHALREQLNGLGTGRTAWWTGAARSAPHY